MSWKRYRAHKIISATKIFARTPDGRGGVHLYVMEDRERAGLFEPNEPAMAYRAEVGWYAVRYEDGYRSVSPPEPFETGYREITEVSRPVLDLMIDAMQRAARSVATSPDVYASWQVIAQAGLDALDEAKR